MKKNKDIAFEGYDVRVYYTTSQPETGDKLHPDHERIHNIEHVDILPFLDKQDIEIIQEQLD